FILIRELLFALVILYVFLFSGQAVLDFLNVKQETVSIAGGIILFLIALKMIFPVKGASPIGLAAGEEPYIVPLAIPLIAGPSTLAALILLSNQSPDRMGDWALALGTAWIISAAILLFSGVFHRILGERGLAAMERLMGMILVMIAIQMFLNGVGTYFSHVS
ncbi:MAG: MarC family protein, partial [Pseudomonadota bacterium]|nr:MarC family protein [Pseudomonadota bacterium]